MAEVVTRGLVETVGEIRRIAVGLDAAARRITEQQAALLERQAKDNFVGSHARGEPHVGGTFPNVVTGNLRRSIQTDPVLPIGPGIWGTRVGPTAIYGRRVELGYPGGGAGRGHHKTRPFPYLAPAAEQTAARMHAIALAQWGGVLR